MPGLVAIPVEYMGRTIFDSDIKSYLIGCNAEFHFDMGVALNIWHPYREKRQGVFFRGGHICSMDRGMISENPIWSVIREKVTLPGCELTYAEMADPMTMTEFIDDGNGNETPTGCYVVERARRHKKLFVGWRHTLRKVLNKNIPGVTQLGLEQRFGIDLSYLPFDEVNQRGAEMIEDDAEKSRIVIATS